ncbi:MAG: type II toxin-antitoxin system PemK/MazF family toxin [Candidatus Acidiferrales bacterium]
MRRGEIYRNWERIPERGDKPSFYVVVSRNYVAAKEQLSTVICAPVYSEVLGIDSEVVIGREDGMPRECAIRCDCLMLIFKRKLTGFVGTLPAPKMPHLNRALRFALELDQ